MDRKYKVSLTSNGEEAGNISTGPLAGRGGQIQIQLNVGTKDIPFNVWRDVARLSFTSSGGAEENLTFVMLAISQAEAERILLGAMFYRVRCFRTFWDPKSLSLGEFLVHCANIYCDETTKMVELVIDRSVDTSLPDLHFSVSVEDGKTLIERTNLNRWHRHEV